jgi:phosphoglucosamine mutase
MKDNLFGTDGIRSEAGTYPLDEASLLKLGAVIASQARSSRVLIARDTRESGPAIETQLARGCGRCTRLFFAGVLPTPGLAYLTRTMNMDVGIMISASHNPFADNGIKIFNHRGEKISPRLEKKISEEFRLRKRAARPAPARSAVPLTAEAYAEFLFREGRGLDEQRLKVAMDCANGASSRFAPALFDRLGMRVAVAYAEPDGRNINSVCGSTYPQALRRLVTRSKAALGVAFDGDADRVIFADAGGRILEGDHVLFLIARYLGETEPRFNRIVAGTVMANLGLERALEQAGIRFLRTGVGDKQVYRLMKKHGAILGGEPSGHIILRHRQTTGDGLLTVLFFMKALRFFGSDAADLFDRLPLFPQETLNIRVRRRKDLESWTALQRAAVQFARKHGRSARLLIRYSGTEPKIRIMIEARDRETIQKSMPVFRSLVENEIGE